MFTCSTPWITPQQSDPPVRYNAVFLEVGGRLACPRFLRESLPQFGSEKCQNGRRPSKENDQASHLPICGSSRIPDSMRCLERCLATDVKDLYYIWEIANSRHLTNSAQSRDAGGRDRMGIFLGWEVAAVPNVPSRWPIMVIWRQHRCWHVGLPNPVGERSRGRRHRI